MMNYIFDRLQVTELAIKRMRRKIRNQSRFNRSLAAFAIAITAYAVVVELHNYEQDKMIGDLDKKVEELKRMKGD